MDGCPEEATRHPQSRAVSVTVYLNTAAAICGHEKHSNQGERQMSTVGWLLVVAVGIALGFSAGRLWPGSAARVTALERERNTAREDLQKYRNDVGQHFERTAELFDKVTTDYRDLYEHLARSERQLGAIHGESSGSSLAQPEQRRLAANAAAA